MDPVTILAVKVPLANLLLELILSNIDGLIVSEAIWNLVNHLAYSLEMMQTDLNMFLSYSPEYRIVVGEWIIVSLRILEEFFNIFDIGTHSLILTHSPTHLPTHSPTHSPTHLLRFVR